MADEAKEKGQKPQKEQGQKDQQKPKGKEATSIVRIAGRDINGSYKIPNALMHIKGLGFNLAHVIALDLERKYGINEDTPIGTLSEEQVVTLESVIKNPASVGVPNFLLNRRKDTDTGEDMHLVGTDLTIRIKQDIDNDIRIQTWRGFRHQYRQKVRGQRTRSTGRTGTTIGVIKKSAAAPAAGAPTAGEKAAGAQAASAGPQKVSAAPTTGAPAKPAAKPAAKPEEKK